MVGEEAHVKLKSGTGHQWQLVLIDCCVIPLRDRDSEIFRTFSWVLCWGNNRADFFFFKVPVRKMGDLTLRSSNTKAGSDQPRKQEFDFTFILLTIC